MYRRQFGTLVAVVALCGLAGAGSAQVSIGASFGKEGLTGFYLGVGEYYKVPEKEVVVVRDRGIPDEDLPVVFLIATRAGIAPDSVIKLRLSGQSWLDITLHYGLSPEIFYVPVQQTPGPPYGKAYGYYKNKPRSEWNTIKLSDAEVVNLVNLKFISEHYGYSPDEVIRMRASGKNFVEINHEVKQKKQGKGGSGNRSGAAKNQGSAERGGPAHHPGAAKNQGSAEKGGPHGSQGKGKGKKP